MKPARISRLLLLLGACTTAAFAAPPSSPDTMADQHEDRFTDIFEKRDGRWLAVNEQKTRVAPASAVHH